MLVGGWAAAAPAPSAAASPKLTLSPAPDTPDASPNTQISVLGVAPSRIAKVTVTGATSGAHRGALRPYSGRRGASFVPTTPLAQGERVQVTVAVRDAKTVKYTFTVARFSPAQPVLNLKPTEPEKLDHFVSRPDLMPPPITVLKPSGTPPATPAFVGRAARSGAAEGTDGGAIFMAPLPSPVVHPESNNTITITSVPTSGPMIVNDRGDLIWFKQLTPPDVAANLGIQRYRGRRVLTWWQGGVTANAFGLGKGVIADTSYRTVATVKAGNGYAMDLHEFRLMPNGDALFTVYSPILVHLPGTPAGQLSPLLDSIVQQVDTRTGLVVWEWHAYGHIPLSESYASPANSASYDVFHINSVQPLPRDKVLISARDTAAIYLVDRRSGQPDWRLGGKKSTYKMGKGARFWLQHDATLLPGNRVSVFDDEAGPPQKAPSSRGLILALDDRRKTATVVQQYLRKTATSAQSEGSVQVLPSKDVFVGYGATGFFSQFTPAGTLTFDAQLPDGDGSYRTYRYPWAATPATKPAVAAQRVDAARVAVYASWNGATAVAKWQVLSGPDGASLKPGPTAAATGFETRLLAPSAAAFAVRALDARGRVLSTSNAVPAS